MSFANIIGQESAIKFLKNIISQHLVSGAYLFVGPDGTGRQTTAIEFAKALNCQTKGLDSCDRCVSCRKISSMNHPDVSIVSRENKNGSIKIETIRDIIYQTGLKPYEGNFRVFIINDAETMTEEAQNAFLKLLEEPPSYHIFILTSSNISGLLPTVVSRCKIIKFYSIPQRCIKDFLRSAGLEDEKAETLSHIAMGSLGSAVLYKKNDIIAKRDKVINDFFLRKSVLLREDTLVENSEEDPETSLCLLLYWYRDLFISQFLQDRDFLLNIDRAGEIFSYAKRFSLRRLERDLLIIMDTFNMINKNVNPKIALFNMAISLRPV